MDADTAAIIDAIGPRLRTLRRNRKMTLADLSGLSGISMSTLSRLETGRRQPSLELLLPLARAFAVSLDRMIAAPQTGDPRITLEPRRLASGGIAVPLTIESGPVQAFKHVLGPREPSVVTHEGHAWIYVLAGRLRLILGDQEHEIEKGENVEFDATVPHWFGPAGEHPVEILHLYGPDGSRPITRIVSTPGS